MINVILEEKRNISQRNKPVFHPLLYASSPLRLRERFPKVNAKEKDSDRATRKIKEYRHNCDPTLQFLFLSLYVLCSNIQMGHYSI